MSLSKAKALRERRATIHALVTGNLEEIAKQDTAEARRQELIQANEKAFTEADQIKTTIDQMERAADLDSELGDTRGHLPSHRELSDDPKERSEQSRRAVEAYMRFGYSDLSEEARSVLAPASMGTLIADAASDDFNLITVER